MKKITKLLLAAAAALTLAVSFTGCADLANALGGALLGSDQTLKVTTSESNLMGKKIYFYVAEMEEKNGTYVATGNYFDYNSKVNSAKEKVSDKFKTLKTYKIYISGTEDYTYNYSSKPLDQKPVVKKAASGASSVSTVGNNEDIFAFAGDIDYEIVLTVSGGEIVATMKGERQSKK